MTRRSWDDDDNNYDDDENVIEIDADIPAPGGQRALQLVPAQMAMPMPMRMRTPAPKATAIPIAGAGGDIDRVPLEPGALVEWAVRHGVSEQIGMALDRAHLRALDPASSRILERARPMRTIGEILVDPGHGRGPVSSLLPEASYQRLRRAVLLQIIETARARARLFPAPQLPRVERRPPEHPALISLAAKLSSLRAPLSALHRGVGQPASRRPTVRFDRECGALEVLPNGEHGAFRVSFDLRTFPDTLGTWCACGRNTCRTVLQSIDLALDWLGTEAAANDKALIQHLAEPGWRRALAALGQGVAAAQSSTSLGQGEDARLVFRLMSQPPYLGVAPMVQSRRKNGSWSAGKALGRGRTESLREMRDPVIAAAVQLCGTSGYNSIGSVMSVLELLAGRALLFGEKDTEHPFDVRRAEPRLSVVARPGDKLSLVLTLDGDPESAAVVAEAAKSGGNAIYIDGARLLCRIARLDPWHCALERALTEYPAEYPREAQTELLRSLGTLSDRIAIGWPEELAAEPVLADERLLARLACAGDGLDVELWTQPIADGPIVRPGQGAGEMRGLLASATGDSRLVRVARDLPAEVARAQSLLSSLPLGTPPAPGALSLQIVDGDEALDVLAELEKRSDVVVAWAELGETRSVRRDLATTQLRVELKDKFDWFGLEGSVEVDGASVPLGVLLAAVRDGRRYVKVGPGQFARIAGELRARLIAVGDVVHSGRSGLEVSLAAMPAISDLIDGVSEAQVSERWLKLRSRLDAALVEDVVLPANLKASLRGYQLEGYRWLSRLSRWGLGACLADDMGLGKTVQALALLLSRAAEGPALVVAPTSVCFNWAREAERFAPDLRVCILREGDRKKTIDELGPNDLLIASYGLLVRHRDDLAERKFATLILDEAQAIKNAATRRARAARDLRADFRVALTGTPVENHVGELWSLLRAVVPGLLGSWEEFKDRFATPIENGHDRERMAALARVVRPFILRRKKSEVATELPPRTDIRRMVTMPPEQKRRYDEERQIIVARLTGALETEERPEQQRFYVLAAITRLRQLACSPRLVDPGSTIPSGKLDALITIVEELRESGHRALVFSQFTGHLSLVREAFAAQNPPIEFLYLDGQTPEVERRRRVDAFQGGTGDVFLISLKAGGTGLNLTAADYVIHLDPWWNPAVEDQASDRAHRIGQDKPVTVYRLVSQGTIEEAILALHERKRDLVAGLLDGTDAAARLSTGDLVDLIRAGMTGTGSDAGDRADEGETEQEPPPTAVITATRMLAAPAPLVAPSEAAPRHTMAALRRHRVVPASAKSATLDLDLLIVGCELRMRRSAAMLRDAAPAYAEALRRFAAYVRASNAAVSITGIASLEEAGLAYWSGLKSREIPGAATEYLYAHAALKHLVEHARKAKA